MKKIFKIISLISLTFIIFSCTEKMDIKLEDTYTRLVVEAKLSTDTTVHIVKLTKTSGYFSNSAPLPVSGALVTISDGSQIITLTENLSKPGIYETPPNTYGKVGKTYELLIKNVDIDNDGNKEEYTSKSTIYPINQVDSIGTRYYDDYEIWEIQCYVLDPPTEDYYLFNIYKNNVLITDTISEPLVVDDKLYNGNYTNGIGVGYLRDRRLGEKANIGDSVMLEVWRIDKSFYKFMMQLRETVRPQTPLFSGPPANVKGNISNGAIGYFTAYSVSRARNVVK
jgi:hypothetical protein